MKTYNHRGVSGDTGWSVVTERTNDEPTNEATDETPVDYRKALVLPLLGICWLGFLVYTDLNGDGANVDLIAMLLGIVLMVAGVFRFLSDSSDGDEAPKDED